jgi:4-carboxymuconolactone decarboxylase
VSGASLDPETRLLAGISAALARGDDPALAAALREAAAGGAEPRAVEETLLQSYLFLGFPAALAALARWRETLGDPAVEGDPLAVPPGLDAWRERGEEVCRVVYGRAYEGLRRNVARAHPAMDRWMIEEGYGKVLGRPGLPLRARELCIVAILAGAGREPQLHSHLRGALHAGAEPGEVEEALEAGLEGRDAGCARRARALWRRVRDAGGRRDAGETHVR